MVVMCFLQNKNKIIKHTQMGRQKKFLLSITHFGINFWIIYNRTIIGGWIKEFFC